MLVVTDYIRERALEYARRWAFSRNPLFENYTGQGGDCTNFVSQCIYAGSCVMNYTPTFGWYYISPTMRAPAWTGVEFFYNFITSNEGVGPFGEEVGEAELSVGDVIQLADTRGDYYHSLLVTGAEDGEYLVASHSNDALDRPLTTYSYGSARFIRISGVRLEIPDAFAPDCFERFISGEGI